ncbi:uncharacterized protein LOC129725390 isoform X2 [Wyeomyia smithii]|uniref:uncharacterized protein LOC129725390 isoform X2 n=1 Tax=Wyeomyia smithii TaxID=174621 RepID=UPI002467CE56|nr:uncharacterized protein LOC129725390 isoform X2 [Wyeomyia smithii]
MRSILGTKSFNINEPPVDQCKKGKSKWCRKAKRKRCLPVVFCAICFSILIAWVMGDIFRQQTVSDSDVIANETSEEAVEFEYAGNQSKARIVEITAAKDHSCSLSAQCKISCTGVDVTKMSAKITKLLEDLLCSEITLVIESLYIADQKLVLDWLQLDVDVNVAQLELKTSDIMEITPGAFDMGCLYGATSLSLNSLQVTYLDGYTFIGLSQLKELNLKNLPLKQVGQYLLSPMMFTLTRLLVEGSLDKINPFPLTGMTQMHNLAVVSFDYNIFEDVLDGDSFAFLPLVSSLYLRNSNITTLKKEVIESVSKSVKQIHLDGNELETIGEGVFDSVRNMSVKIYLKNNPLICDCNLNYLHDLIVSNPDMFDDVTCDKPDELSGELVASVVVCQITPTLPTTELVTHEPNDTETTKTTESTMSTSGKPTHMPPGDETETTETVTPTRPPFTMPTKPPVTEPDDPPTAPEPTETSSTTPKPTIPPPPPTPIPTTTTSTSTTTAGNVYTLQCLSSAVTVESSLNILEASEIGVQKRSKIFAVSEAQEGAVDVLLDQLYQNSLILWFYDTSSNTLFPTNIEDSASCVEISGRVKRITNLVPDMTYIFCILYVYENTISPFDCLPHKLLPTYGQRTWLIEDQKIIVISILISSILVSILIGIMGTYCFINSFTTYKKACRNVSANLCSDKSATNQCYMTPVPANPPKRQRHKRSVSDTSIESCRSYVSAVVPASQFQYISWKMENRSRPSMEYYPKDPPPPPLPPHPSKRLKKQKSEIKINFQEIYDEPTSASYTSCPPAKMHPGKH